MSKPQKIQNSKYVTEAYLDMRLDARLGQFQQEFRVELMEEVEKMMQEKTITILEAIDKVLTRFDAMEKDSAAHTILHTRIDDKLHNHDQRIKKIEAKI